MVRLVRHLRRTGRLRPELSERRALAIVMLLTGYETCRELRAELPEREIAKALQDAARSQLLA